MEQSSNPTQSFNERCHFFQVNSESPLSSQNFRPSTLKRIENVKERALAKKSPSCKKLGVDFSKKTIAKEDVSKKEVSQREMSQLTKSLHGLGLTGEFSLEELSKALEPPTLDQGEELLLASHVSNPMELSSPSRIVVELEKLIKRQNRIMQQIHTINATIKQKLQNSERVDPCLVFMAINLACQK